MSSKKYFHDRTVLLLLSFNTFFALLGVLLILLNLNSGGADDYIVEYRSNLGLSAFKSGSVSTFIGFVIFNVFVLAYHALLSFKSYPLNRKFSRVVLALGLLLLLLSLIVSNALLVLR